jgi:multidrug efflux pump subunit AcrA (membrane-fusion protein)
LCREDAGLPRARKAAAIACGVIVIGLSISAWLWSLHSGSAPEAGRPPSQASLKPFRVLAGSLTSQLAIMGTVAAGRGVAVTAPFDGIVRERKVQLGDPVAAGDLLVVMDGGEIQSRLREAQSGLLKAAMTVNDLDHWESGPEVTRAKRALDGAKASLANLERKVTETKGILDRGIVSRDEYDTLVQQRDSQKLTVAGAQQDLTVAAARGGPEVRRLAELDLENAKAKFGDIKQQVDGADVRAPGPGVLLRPPVTSQSSAVQMTIEAGMRVQRGQALFTIADMASLVVDGKIDEIDVNHVRIGQAVAITSDAFPGVPLSGRVVGVGAEADRDTSSRIAMFNVRAALAEKDDGRRDAIRIGMSARMTIDVATKPNAVIVPIAAVQRRPSGTTVTVANPQTGAQEDRLVTLGATTPGGIEIVSGVQSGDVVMVP